MGPVTEEANAGLSLQPPWVHPFSNLTSPVEFLCLETALRLDPCFTQ